VRFRVCSPVSPASVSSMLIGFLANNGFPMRLSAVIELGEVCPASIQPFDSAGYPATSKA
jgi:hypothetical protein